MLKASNTHLPVLRFLFFVLACLGVLLLLLSSAPQGQAGGLALLALVLWATGLLPEHLTALLFFLLAMLLAVAPAEVIFSGFASSALWLVFGGLVLGTAISSTGLGKRLAGSAARLLSGSYLKILAGLVAGSLAFSFLMPSSMGRVVLLTPIALSLAEHFGFTQGSKGRTGILLAVILGSYIPAFAILPANVPNMTLAGLAETQYNFSIFYGTYLLLHFPILGLAKALVLVALLYVFYRDQVLQPVTAKEDAAAWSPQEILLAIVILLMLGLWMTDFLHRISPAWIALGGALFLLFPKIQLVNQNEFNQKINWTSLLFIAGILGLGAMINYTGLGARGADWLLQKLPLQEDQKFSNYVLISVSAALTGMATTLPAVPAVFTPLSERLAQASGFSIDTVLMLQVVGFSTVVLPYQAPPLVVGLHMSGEKLWNAAKISLLLALISIFVLLPINYLWWKVLDWIP
jgi:di/tricarboxylate transporter